MRDVIAVAIEAAAAAAEEEEMWSSSWLPMNGKEIFILPRKRCEKIALSPWSRTNWES
jgi:hypothetical protein